MNVKPRADIKTDLATGYARGGITNFNTVGVANTQVEAAGDVVGDLYDYGIGCVKSGMAETATGTWLDTKVKERKITRLAAVKTRGYVPLGRSAAGVVDYPIAAGKIVSTPKDSNGKRYRYTVVADTYLPAGDTSVQVLVEAEETGDAYNVAAGAITEVVSSIPGIETVTNASDWVTIEGAASESDERLRLRYYLAWDALSTGSTSAAYLFWALSADVRVAVAWIDFYDPRSDGTIDIYIVPTGGGSPSASLIAAVQAYVDARRPAGSDVLVLGPATKTVNIAVTIHRYAGVDQSALDASIRAMLAAYFNPSGSSLFTWIRPLGVGRKVVFSQLIEICTRPNDVYDAVFSDPTVDELVAGNELPTLGTVTITHEEVVV